MVKVYPAVFTETKDKRNTYLVYVPDIDRCTEGSGIEDAIFMAKDLIGCMLYDIADSDFPAATPIEKIDVSKSEFADEGKSFVSLVDVDIEAFRRLQKNRNVRRNITLPEWLDDMASRAKINVSAVAQNALKEKLGVPEIQ